jgi:hypothetical protein
MEKVEPRIYDSIKDYLDKVVKDDQHRYKSWEHCYTFFFEREKIREKEDYELASLHLFVYLASWGMYRGSSFLLEKDYKVHTDAIKIILDHKFDKLLEIEPNKLIEKDNLRLLNVLVEKLKGYYNNLNVIHEKKIANITDTLMTKILLGTLGCTPAYDELFVKGLKKQLIKPSKFGDGSIVYISHFFENNKNEFYRAQKFVSEKRKLKYPAFKLVDMFFWKVGECINEK